MCKLYSYGIRDQLLLWLQRFFSNRTHQTKVGDFVSELSDLISGVVQGSGIRPIMFISFINDLITALEKHGITAKLFADDLKLYLHVTDACDLSRLQSALSALEDWERLWQLSVSPSKCCVLSVGKKVLDDSSLKFSIDGSTLPVVNFCVDLGITISSDLSPRLHINTIVAKAHKRANAIHRCFISKDINTLMRAFIVYVRPIVEHNSSLWSPHFKSDIESIERVQRKFTKRLPGFSQYSYQDRLKRLSLPSLELRRLLHDLILCYKIIFGLINVQCDEFFAFSMRITRGHPYKLTKVSRSTSCRSQFFSQRIVNVWNSLPSNTVDFTSLTSFKRSINNVNYSEFLKVF